MTLRLPGLALLALPSLFLFAACSSTTIIQAAPGDDAGTGDDQSDGGGVGDDGGKSDAPSSGFPAAHPAAPKVTSYGGPVLKAPRIVPILFQGDTYANDIKTFTQKIGSSSYWKATTSEYGVGAATAIDPIVITTVTPGDNITDDDVQSFLQSQLSGSGPLGAPDSGSIYAIFYPESTTISDGSGSSCQQFGGYHNETSAGGKSVAYAVLPRCQGGAFGGGTALDTLTIASSHEFIEAATDPFPQNNPAYGIVDMDHLVWALFPLPEVGDMCTFSADAYYKPTEIGYTVQRTWSNAAAAAGHNPCVPAAPGVYFNAAPVLKQKIPLDFGQGQSADTLGISVPNGKSATIDLALYSDAATSGAWNVQAYDMGQYTGGPEELTFSLDKDSGKNGDTLKLTITRKADGQYGGSEFMIVSSMGKSQEFIYFGFAGN